MTASQEVEANKAVVRRFYEEVWNRGNVDVVFDTFADDYLRHDLRPSNAAPGPEGQKKVAAAFREAFPDLDFRIDLIVAEADFVVARWTANGTHTGRWGNVEATGRKARFSGANFFRLRDGKVVEIWNHRDDLGLAEQLGAQVFAGAPPEPSV